MVVKDGGHIGYETLSPYNGGPKNQKKLLAALDDPSLELLKAIETIGQMYAKINHNSYALEMAELEREEANEPTI